MLLVGALLTTGRRTVANLLRTLRHLAPGQPDRPDGVGVRQPGEVELAPGKEIVLHELKRELRPAK